MPGYILLQLIKIVTSPGTKDIGSCADPIEEMSENDGKERGFIHLILGDSGQLFAEVAEFGMNDRANETTELISDLAFVNANRADFDGLHFVAMFAIVPAGGFEVADDEVGVWGWWFKDHTFASSFDGSLKRQRGGTLRLYAPPR